MAGLMQRMLERGDDQPAHQACIAETHFGLGGMHVDVHEAESHSRNRASVGWRSRARKSA